MYKKYISKFKEADYLSEDQHDLLNAIGYHRYQIHTNQKGIYNENDDTDSIDFFDNIDYVLMKNKLPKMNLRLNIKDIPSSYDRTYDLIDDTDEAEEKNYLKFQKIMDKLEDDVTKYLKQIDIKYKTDYAVFTKY